MIKIQFIKCFLFLFNVFKFRLKKEGKRWGRRWRIFRRRRKVKTKAKCSWIRFWRRKRRGHRWTCQRRKRVPEKQEFFKKSVNNLKEKKKKNWFDWISMGNFHVNSSKVHFILIHIQLYYSWCSIYYFLVFKGIINLINVNCFNLALLVISVFDFHYELFMIEFHIFLLKIRFLIFWLR